MRRVGNGEVICSRFKRDKPQNASFKQSLLNEDAFDLLRNTDCLYGMRDYHLTQFLSGRRTHDMSTDGLCSRGQKNACVRYDPDLS